MKIKLGSLSVNLALTTKKITQYCNSIAQLVSTGLNAFIVMWCPRYVELSRMGWLHLCAFKAHCALPYVPVCVYCKSYSSRIDWMVTLLFCWKYAFCRNGCVALTHIAVPAAGFWFQLNFISALVFYFSLHQKHFITFALIWFSCIRFTLIPFHCGWLMKILYFFFKQCHAGSQRSTQRTHSNHNGREQKFSMNKCHSL